MPYTKQHFLNSLAGSQRFDLLSNSTLIGFSEMVRTDMAEIDYSFDEIIILSDGVAGSMASIFCSTVSQFSKNSNQTYATPTVKTVAYGEFRISSDSLLSTKK